MKTRRRVICCLLVCTLLLIPVNWACMPAGAASRGGPRLPARSGTIRRAHAQGSSAGAFISVPDIQAFPRIQTYLEVLDAQGNFLHDLKADQVKIIEDGNEKQPSWLRAVQPGAQVVVAINPGPSFAIRNAKAVSRYDLVKEALRAWALSRMGSTLDDLSLYINGGPAESHTASPEKWLAALISEQVDPRAATPSLDALSRAVSLAADAAPRPGMSRAVIFITPPLEGALEEASLENLAAQAREQHVVIHIWLVSSSGAFGAQSAQQLTELSQATGGRTFNFTGEETLPNLEEYIAPLRYIYQLEYQSGVASGGRHEVSIQIEAGEGSITTPAMSFEIDLQPPQPAFVAPPIQIERKLAPAEEAPAETAAPTTPQSDQAETLEAGDSQLIEAVFDFPDGRMRPLVYSALLVDGVVVQENHQSPFNRFTWNLKDISSSGVHRLQIRVRDSLGLTGESVETPVQVSVKQSGASAITGFQRNLPLISVLVVLLAGAFLALVLVVGGKLRPRPLRAAQQRRKIDPVTQPVQIHIEAPAVRRSNWASRLQWPGRDAPQTAEAFLNPLPDSSEDDTLPPIPITANGLILGSNADQATLFIDDPSVEPVHARLMRQEDGSYRISDEGSVAGTWINYTPVSKEGARLENGDLIHVGRIGFRFSLRKPVSPRKPIVIAEPITIPLGLTDHDAGQRSEAEAPPQEAAAEETTTETAADAATEAASRELSEENRGALPDAAGAKEPEA